MLRRSLRRSLASVALVSTLAANAQAQQPGPGEAPLVPPAPDAPTSTAGTDVQPHAPPAPTEAPVSPAGDAAGDAKVKELEARVAASEARLKKLEETTSWYEGLKFQGFVQVEYRTQWNNAAASPNLVNGRLPSGVGSNDVIARADGTTSNQDLIRLRRTRLRALYEVETFRMFLQLDFLPSGGPTGAQGSIMRNAEAYGIARWSKDVRTEFGGGLFMHPFRYEITEASMYRPFLERTWAEANLYPNEREIGMRAKTIVDEKLFIDVGVTNGQKLGQPTFVLVPDLDHGKDGFLVVQVQAGPVLLGLHGVYGSNVAVDTQALRVKHFEKMGVNVSAVFQHTFFPKIGETRAIGELSFGQNMDTGIRYPFGLPAIPNEFRDDVKDLGQRGLYLRAEQDITAWAIAGFRYDMYTPNVAIANNARDTYDLMLGARFGKWFRVIDEVSYAIDNVHAEGAAPPSRQIWQNSLWFQGAFY